MKTDWMKNSVFLAQAAHFLVGLLGVTLPLVLSESVWLSAGGTSLVMGYAVAKEVWFDPKHETNEPFFWNGALDLTFYMVGLLVGWLLLNVTGHV